MKILMRVGLTFTGRPLMPDRIDPTRLLDNENQPARPAPFVKSLGTPHLLDNP